MMQFLDWLEEELGIDSSAVNCHSPLSPGLFVPNEYPTLLCNEEIVCSAGSVWLTVQAPTAFP